MANKLGLMEERLVDVERKIVNLKMNLIDEWFTFNKKQFNFEYLVELHNFLFNDFYFKGDIGIRKLTNIEENNINDYFNKLNYLCINEPNKLEEILLIIRELWGLQIFVVGNTRTLLTLLKIINNAFYLNLDVDINIEINSNPRIFELQNFVNQKGLTK